MSSEKLPTAFCVHCGHETEYDVCSETVSFNTDREFDVPFSCVEESAFCKECGKEIYVSSINDRNAAARRAAYAEAQRKALTKREFYVDTPLGKLKVWAKHQTDHPEDFPGVYIDLVREGYDDDLLCCVEYDSCSGALQACVYQPGSDVPELTMYETDEKNEEDDIPFLQL